MVDEGTIAMRHAVEISYLPKKLQEELADAMASKALPQLLHLYLL